VFPASGVTRFNVTNNFIGGPNFPTITFNGSGFTLSGAFIVTTRVGAENLAGVNRVTCALQLGGPATFFINGDTGALLDIDGNVTLGANTLSVSAGGGSLFLGGVISGTGGISKISGGTVRFDGNEANSYTGLTTVIGGTLELFKGPANTLAVPGDLNISGAADIVRLLRNNQLASTTDVAIGAGGLLDLQTFSTPVATLTLNGGQVTATGAGTLTLNGNVTATGVGATVATIAGNLDIGLGPRTFTVTDNAGTDPDLDITARILGSGGIIKTGAGTLAFSGSASNTFLGLTRAFEGTLLLRRTSFDRSIPGNLLIGDNLGGPTNDVVRLEGFGQINNLSAVIIGSSGLLDCNGISETIGSLAGEGRVIVGPSTLTVGGDGASTTYSGVIAEPGGVLNIGALTKVGAGTLTLTANNTYRGLTQVIEGTLLVNGGQQLTDVIVSPNATLGGHGGVRDVTLDGNLRPGASPGAFDCLSLTCSPQSDVFIELNDGIPGVGTDIIYVQAAVTLNNPTLHVSFGDPPAEGQRFTIIETFSAGPVVGAFAGLPQGSVLTVDGAQLHVSYTDNGNNVALIVTNAPLRRAGFLQFSGGNLNGRLDTDECNLASFVLTNASAAPVTGIRATLIPRLPGWSVTQPFSTYPDLAPGQRATNQTPFQISLLPGHVCGSLMPYDVLVETDNYGAYRVSNIGASSGLSGTRLRFDNNTAVPIPDSGTADSIINVANFSNAIAEVTVSLHIAYPSVQDLDVSLISPGGTVLNLSSDNGGASANYGTGCADNQRTIFDDSPTTNPLITAGTAPFVGTFRPEVPLSVFRYDFGSQVNGPWTLRVTADTGGNVGTLQCWSLFLTPSVCTDGGGPCESCPERTILGTISDQSQVTNGRLRGNGVVSVCGVAKPCPGVIDLAFPKRYDAYTFENGETNACITVTLGVNPNDDCALFSAAYTNAFNPADLCAHYFADIGASVDSGETNSYSFNVAARARFVVVVSQSLSADSQCRYRLDVTGGSCRPVLHITDAGSNRAVLDWTTAAVGYQLERTNALPSPSAPAWAPLTNAPRILNSHYTVTNTVAPDNARFYRLRRP
jgi:autotransporter-associated beta strand protein